MQFVITKNKEECIEASNLFYLIKNFQLFVRKFGFEKNQMIMQLHVPPVPPSSCILFLDN